MINEQKNELLKKVKENYDKNVLKYDTFNQQVKENELEIMKFQEDIEGNFANIINNMQQEPFE